MAVRLPIDFSLGASEIKKRDSEKVYSMSRVFKSEGVGNVKLLWEQTTFVDCNGKAFYDCFGIPFQGCK